MTCIVVVKNSSDHNPNKKPTIEINFKRFLDTKTITKNGEIETSVFRESTNLPLPWLLKVPRRYQQSAIKGDLQYFKINLY